MQENYPVLTAQNTLKSKFEQLKKIPIKTEEFTIGRSSDSSVVIPAYRVISKRHCIFKKINNTEWSLEDLSTVGIQVNKTKLKKRNQYTVRHNDVIWLDPAGEFVYKFIYNVDEDEPPRKRTRHNNLVNDTNTNDEQVNSPSNSKNKLEKETEKRVQDLVSTFAGQIESLQGEGSQQKRTSDQMRVEKLNLVKKNMEEKICAEIMGPLKEISTLKTKLLEKQKKYLVKINLHEMSRHALRQQLEARLKEKEREKIEKEKLKGDLEQVNSQLKSVETEKNALERICDGAKHSTLTEIGELMESELQCSVCAGMFVCATTLNCSHMFCRYCITQWKKKKNECPLCRTIITSECRSLVLDAFIDKMTSSLRGEPAAKRRAALAEREEAEKLALQNPVVYNDDSDSSVDVPEGLLYPMRDSDSDTSSDSDLDSLSNIDEMDSDEGFMAFYSGNESESSSDSGNDDGNSSELYNNPDISEDDDGNMEGSDNGNESLDGNESVNEDGDESGNENGNESVNEYGNESVNEDGDESVNEDGNESVNEDGDESVNEDGNESVNEYGNESVNEDGDESVNEDGNESVNEYGNESLDEDGNEMENEEAVENTNEDDIDSCNEVGNESHNDDDNESVNEDEDQEVHEEDGNNSGNEVDGNEEYDGNSNGGEDYSQGDDEGNENEYENDGNDNDCDDYENNEGFSDYSNGSW